MVLQGEVVDGIQYELATNVTDHNPLNGTRIESFILTTTKMAMMCLQDMPNFIITMPGPLNFNQGHDVSREGIPGAGLLCTAGRTPQLL